MKFMVKNQSGSLIQCEGFYLNSCRIVATEEQGRLASYLTEERTIIVFKDLEEWIQTKIAISQCSYEMAGIKASSGNAMFDAFVKTAIFTFPKE